MESMDDPEYKEMNLLWNTLLGERNCATYDGSVDLDVLNVMETLGGVGFAFYTRIAQNFKLNPNYVQLINFILCGADLAEYGTSPRGAWLTKKGEEFYARMKPYHDSLKGCRD